MNWETIVKLIAAPLLALGIYAGDQRWNQQNAVTVLQLQSSEVCQWKIEELIKKIEKLSPGDPLRAELQKQLTEVRRICGRK